VSGSWSSVKRDVYKEGEAASYSNLKGRGKIELGAARSDFELLLGVTQDSWHGRA
jgi:hypothetical protein